MAHAGRVVALIDMDCFYVQVEQRERPELRGKPCAVVQYNAWKGGGIIAVSYEARAHGVSRNMRGDEAKARCPALVLCSVPCVRGKADLSRYRDAGAEVLRVLARFGAALERASVDEAYLDLTEILDREVPALPSPSDLPSSFLVGHEDSSPSEWLQSLLDEGPEATRLARGAVLVERMRAAVEEQTQFRCSAGIAPNKVLAKLACGMHKPNRQTIVTPSAVEELFNQLPVKKIRHLGGKLGTALNEDLGVATMGQLRDGFSERDLSEHFGAKTGRWLFELARGRDSEPVVGRQLAKSIGCSKSFPGATALDTRAKVTHWIEQLADEVVERLERDREQNSRVARSLVVFLAHQGHPRLVSVTRTCALTRYDVAKVTHDVLVLLRPFNATAAGSEVWSPAVTYLGLSAGKFADLAQQDGPSIRDLFAKSSGSQAPPPPQQQQEEGQGPSEAAAPSRALTYFERLGQQQQQKVEKTQKAEPEAVKATPGRPSFFERRQERVREAEAENEKAEAKKKKAEAKKEEEEAEAEFEGEEAEAELEGEETEAEFEGEEAEAEFEGEEAEAEFEGEESKAEFEGEESKAEFEGEEAEAALLYSDSDFMACPQCGARVLIFHMPEHTDRHLAEQLHRELQREMAAEAEGRRPAKRKRGRPPGSARAKRAKEGAAFSLDKFLR